MVEPREPEEREPVEIERMPNFGGWEYFKAIDGEESRERWTLALRHIAAKGRNHDPAIEYALFTDPKKDPDATGRFEVDHDELDDGARQDVIRKILGKHDASLAAYADRLAFSLSHAQDHDEDDEDVADDEEA